MNVATTDFPKVAIPPARLLIGGAWVEAASGETIPVVNPSTEQVFARIAAGGAEDVARAVEAGIRSIEHANFLDAPTAALMVSLMVSFRAAATRKRTVVAWRNS